MRDARCEDLADFGLECMSELDKLKRSLGKTLRIKLDDGRVIEGEFQCMDKDLNFIVGGATEYHGMTNSTSYISFGSNISLSTYTPAIHLMYSPRVHPALPTSRSSGKPRRGECHSLATFRHGDGTGEARLDCHGNYLRLRKQEQTSLQTCIEMAHDARHTVELHGQRMWVRYRGGDRSFSLEFVALEAPSEIQKKAITPIVKRCDLIAQAQSGSGKENETPRLQFIQHPLHNLTQL